MSTLTDRVFEHTSPNNHPNVPQQHSRAREPAPRVRERRQVVVRLGAVPGLSRARATRVLLRGERAEGVVRVTRNIR